MCGRISLRRRGLGWSTRRRASDCAELLEDPLRGGCDASPRGFPGSSHPRSTGMKGSTWSRVPVKSPAGSGSARVYASGLSSSVSVSGCIFPTHHRCCREQTELQSLDMPSFAASRREGDGRCGRHRAPSDGERLRSVRERLELMVSVLGELEYLRHRQQLLVLSALKEEVKEARSDAQLSCEENILVLRKQLVGPHGPHRREAPLTSRHGSEGQRSLITLCLLTLPVYSFHSLYLKASDFIKACWTDIFLCLLVGVWICYAFFVCFTCLQTEDYFCFYFPKVKSSSG